MSWAGWWFLLSAIALVGSKDDEDYFVVFGLFFAGLICWLANI